MAKNSWKPCIAQGLAATCKYAKPVTVVEKYGETRREIQIDACISPKRKCQVIEKLERGEK